MVTDYVATPWSVETHDPVPSVDFFLNPLESHTYLLAFLAAEGKEFSRPYDNVRKEIRSVIENQVSAKRPGQAPRSDISDERIRTWKALFERFGFIRVDPASAKITLTSLGRNIRAYHRDLDRRIEGANDHLAQAAVEVLNRCLLRNPVDGGDYPDDSDLFPFRFIWRAMRHLDDKLHWEEMNRVIMRVNYMHDEDSAIAKIRETRKATAGVYTESNVPALGEPAASDGAETKRRITPWFSRAGFGGLLITPESDEQGFRQIVQKYKPLIDSALSREPAVPTTATVSKDSYLEFITAETRVSDSIAASPSDEADIARVLSAVENYGESKIICLSGIPGTGKTRLAKMSVDRLVEGNPYRFAEVQFHESTSYDDFIEGFVPKASGEGFELKPKVFRVMNRRALLDPEGVLYVLLIEEFSRANVHAVLGELITYIEHRLRPFVLTLSQGEEQVAKNLVIMATMNPRDKSAMTLDHAILRRIHQVTLESSTDRLKSILGDHLPPDVLDQLAAWFDEHIAILPFGHAEFSHVRSESDLRNLWHGTLKHFLVDYRGETLIHFEGVEQAYPWR